MPTDAAALTWIVVAHRGRRDLERLLPTLGAAIDAWRARGFRAELVVADAASPDDTSTVAAGLVPDARVHVERDNRGYGATANAAAAGVTTPWIAVSNADLEIPVDGLADLPAVLASADPRVGLVGPRLLTPDGRLDAWAGGPAPTLASLLTGRQRRVSQDETPVDWLTGACLFVRTPAWRAVGGFDEGYRLYYEDVDLALRLRERGWTAIRAPSLSVVHHAPHHRRTADPRIERIVARSRLRYFRRHRPRLESHVLAGIHRLRGLVDRLVSIRHD